MKTINTLLLVFVALLSAPLTVSGINENEPNDSPETANSLDVGDIAYGTGGAMWEPDWWKVTLTEDGDFTVIASGISSDIHLALYDEEGVDYFMWQWGSTDVTVYHHTLGAGTYYIRIWSYYSWSTEYEMTTVFATQTTLNDTEPNNDVSLALELDENATAFGHINYYYEGVTDLFDCYKIEIPDDGHLELTLSSENNIFLWLYLFDSDGYSILNQGNSDGAFIVDRPDLAAGEYYALIGTYYTFEASGYTLKSEFTPPEQANDPEPNNQLTDATWWDINSSIEGHSNYFGNGYRDTFDFYTIELPYTGDLDINLTPGTTFDMWCSLYASDGITLINSATSNTEMHLYNADLSAGTYYVVVNMYYSMDYTGYTLSNEYETDVVSVSSESITLELFPNPCDDKLSFTYSGNSLENANVEIYSATGELVEIIPAGVLNKGEFMYLDVSHLSNGVYVFLLREYNTIMGVNKFLCQH